MGIVIAIVTAAILAVIIFQRPYVGLVVAIICEYLRIGTLLPDFGKIHFVRIILLFLILGIIRDFSLNRTVKIPRYLQNLAQLGFLSVMAINVPFAYIKTRAYTTFVGHLSIIALYFIIIILLDSPDKLKKFIQFFLFANVGLALIGLHKYFIRGGKLDYIATGGFVSGSNDFALIINSAIPFAFYFYQAEKTFKKKILYLLVFALLITAVVCAFSRGGWVTLIGIAFLLALFSSYKIRAAMLIAIAGGIILLTVPPEFVSEFKTISTETGTAINRFELWNAAVRMFLDHPILGVGLNSFPSVYGRFYMLEDAYSAGWRTTHNLFFQLISEMGILGAIFFVLILYWIFKDLLTVQGKLKASGLRNSIPFAISQALLVSISGYLIGGAFLSVLYYPPLYIIAALAVALRNTVEKELMQEDPLASNQSTSPFYQQGRQIVRKSS